jgi:CHAT domain-containing protein
MVSKKYSQGAQKTLAEFNALRFRGDNSRFLKKVDSINDDNELWEELHFHKFNILLKRNELARAKEESDLLLGRLTSHEFTLRIKLHAQYLEWLTQSQSFEDANSLKGNIQQTLSKSSSVREKCILRSVLIMMDMTMIELGLRDARQKEDILEVSKKLITDFISCGLEEDAFEELHRTLSFIMAPPIANDDLALSLINLYRGQQFVVAEDYRLASLHYSELGILLESMLNGGSEENYQKKLEEAQLLYKRSNHKTGLAKRNELIGSTLLKFAQEEGVKLLQIAIGLYEEANESVQATACYINLATWFETTGQFKEADKYIMIADSLRANNWAGMDKKLGDLKRAHELSTLGLTIRSSQSMLVGGTKSNSYMKAAFAVNRANAMVANGHYADAALFLVDEIKKLEKYGLTKGEADLVKCFASITSQNYDGRSEESFELTEIAYSRALEGYELLRDHLQAAEVCRELFFQRAQFMNKHEWNDDGIQKLEQGFNKALSYVKGKLDRESRRVYAQILESFATVCHQKKNVSRAVELVDCARDILKGCKLANPLAFNAVYSALPKFSWARVKRDASFYEDIYASLAEANDYFSKVENTLVHRRTLFFMALAKHEQISHCGSQSEEVKRLAELHYKQSFEIVQFLIRANLPQVQNLQHALDFSSNLQQQIYQQLFSAMFFALRDTHNPSFGLWILEKNKSQVLLSRLLPNKEMNIHSEKKGEEPDTMETLLKDTACLEPGQNYLIVQYWYHLNDIYLIGMHSSWDEPRSKLVSQEGKKVMSIVKRFFHTQGGVRRMYQNNRVKEWEECSHIISSITEWSKADDVVCIVPYGELNGVPLHTLKLNGQYLIERNPVHYAPSTTILSKMLQKKGLNYENEVAVFGNPTKDLVNAKEEAESIAKAFGVKAMLEDEIDKQVLLDAFKSSKLVHFAGHGEYLEDGMKGHLKLKGGVRLEAAEIFEEEFNNDLVVLSGCETGVETYNIGDDMVGLTTAFLYAGSQSVVSSLWKVQDYSSSLLFKVFYDEYKQGVSKAVALQRAAKKMIANPKTEHMYHWGAFTLNGTNN